MTVSYLLEQYDNINKVVRLLARVLKEGVQFWHNDASTVNDASTGGGGGGGGGVRETFLWKTFDVYFMLVSFQPRLKFFKHTWLCEFVPLLLQLLNYDIFIHPGTPSN
jgi:ubiquinone/menaquinone biosynthesis C-methylase UbiE